jgi:phage terminase large subunit
MLFTITTATKKVAGLKKRIRALQGGTSASKTISILQVLIDKAQKDESPKITSIVSESLPHLKKGAMRDFLNIMQGHDYYEEHRWNRTDNIYTFKSGSMIEFFGADQPSKVRGPRRDRLFINECNNIAFETFEQLEVRTRDEIYLDWNPSTEFWFYEYLMPVWGTDDNGERVLERGRDDVDHCILTYLDNEALEPNIVASIEQRKGRKGWWQVFGLGQLGEVDGKIYRDWAIVDDVPHEAKLERFGLDFGYSNDPTSIVAVYRYNDGILLDQITHMKGLSNKQIADIILNQESNALVIADSAEPKSIDEISQYNVNIQPCTKGKDSVVNGIQLVQDQRISVTKRSVDIIKEYRNYLWETDKDGRVLNKPEHLFSHSMDAIRYAVESMPRLTTPLTPEQKRTRTFQAAMKRKHAMQSPSRKKTRKFVT